MAHRRMSALRRIDPHDARLLIQLVFSTPTRRHPMNPSSTSITGCSMEHRFPFRFPSGKVAGGNNGNRKKTLGPMGYHIEDLTPRTTLSDCSTSTFRSPSIDSHRTEDLITGHGNYPRIPPNLPLSLSQTNPAKGWTACPVRVTRQEIVSIRRVGDTSLSDVRAGITLDVSKHRPPHDASPVLPRLCPAENGQGGVRYRSERLFLSQSKHLTEVRDVVWTPAVHPALPAAESPARRHEVGSGQNGSPCHRENE